jgi:hypothetical protein
VYVGTLMSPIKPFVEFTGPEKFVVAMFFSSRVRGQLSWLARP